MCSPASTERLPEEMTLTELDAEMGDLSARVAAAQGRMLRLMGEFLAREGNAEFEVLPNRWASWRLGLGTGEARRMVVLAERLRELPELSSACETGRLSPSVAAAIARVATPETEGTLIDMALEGAPSKTERICRTKARIDADAERRRRVKEEAEARAAAGDDGEEAEPPSPPSPSRQRYLSFGPAEGGGWEMHAWLPSEEGALMENALQRSRVWLRGGGRPPHPEVIEGARRRYDTMGWADAALVMAETVLAGGIHERRASERYRVVVHADLERLTEILRGEVSPHDTVAHTANGSDVDTASLERLMCIADLIGLVEEGGRPVRIGDPTEAVPIHIERAVLARYDNMCAHPLCAQTRGLQVHHVVFRSRGGLHDPDLLLPLCPGDHIGLHNGAFTIEAAGPPGEFEFRRRDGSLITGQAPRPDSPSEPLPLLPDAGWARDRSYGYPLTTYGLDVILQRLSDIEDAAARTNAAGGAPAA